VDVSPGESVRIIRELQGLTQTQLSEPCGIAQTTVSGIEIGRVSIGVERPRCWPTPYTATRPYWFSQAGSSGPQPDLRATNDVADEMHFDAVNSTNGARADADSCESRVNLST